MSELSYEVVVAILASVSILSTSFLLGLHFYIKDLYKHPGKLVSIQCLLQLISNFNWILSAFFSQ
jgi:hypothetical protein